MEIKNSRFVAGEIWLSEDESITLTARNLISNTSFIPK